MPRKLSSADDRRARRDASVRPQIWSCPSVDASLSESERRSEEAAAARLLRRSWPSREPRDPDHPLDLRGDVRALHDGRRDRGGLEAAAQVQRRPAVSSRCSARKARERTRASEQIVRHRGRRRGREAEGRRARGAARADARREEGRAEARASEATAEEPKKPEPPKPEVKIVVKDEDPLKKLDEQPLKSDQRIAVKQHAKPEAGRQPERALHRRRGEQGRRREGRDADLARPGRREPDARREQDRRARRTAPATASARRSPTATSTRATRTRRPARRAPSSRSRRTTSPSRSRRPRPRSRRPPSRERPEVRR